MAKSTPITRLEVPALYTIAYLPYPRPSDHPAYRDPQALYPGLLAVQEPVSQTVFLYRFQADEEEGRPTSYSIYNYAGGFFESEIRVNIFLEQGIDEQREDGQPFYRFEAHSRFEDRAGKIISQGLFTRSGEIRWDEQDPSHWLHPQVQALIGFLAGAEVKQPQKIDLGQVITWDIPALLAPELVINRRNFEKHLPHWFAVEEEEECGCWADDFLPDEEDLSEGPKSRLVQVLRPMPIGNYSFEEGKFKALGYVAQVEGAPGSVLKWGEACQPTLWESEDRAGLLPGMSGEELPSGIRDLLAAGELRFPDPRIVFPGED